MQINKPKYTTSIVSVRAGETIPDTFLHKLLEENRSAVGFVVQDKKLEVEKFATLADTAKEVENLKDVLGNTKKFQRMFIFHAFPPEYDEDEIQPWTIIKDSKGNPLLVVAVEGDLPGKDVDGSSEMLGTINEYLGPKIESLFTLVGNDPKKLYAALKDQAGFGADLMNIIGHRAHFYFMPAEGDVFAHGREPEVLPLAGAFSWGSASNAYGYTESAIAAATVVAAAPEPTVRKSKYASADPEPGPKVDDNGIHHIKPAEPKPAVVIPKVVPTPSADPAKIAADTTVEMTEWTPPANLHGKKLKQAYRGVNGGVLPSDWERRPKIMIAVKKGPIKDLKDLAHTAVGNLPASQVLKVEPAKVENVLPVMDGKQQGAIKEWIKKYLDGSSNSIANPLELQKQEAQLAVFSELCLKNGLDEIETWPTSVVAAFCKAFPDGAWLLILELRRDRIARKQMGKLGDVKLSDLTGTEHAAPAAPPALIPNPTPTSPAPAPAAPVHRKSKYA